MGSEDCHQDGADPNYECLLIDVDDTIYPLSSGLSAECTKNIIEYMINTLGMDEDRAPILCTQLYKEYGTTMAGLRATGYEFDYDDYHSYVHGRLPYEWLQPDHTLKSLLLSLPLRKVIFSNGNSAHVGKVLSRLGLEKCFDFIICFESLNPPIETPDPEENPSPIICKPFQLAYEQAFQIAGINPQRTLFFDDSIRNIQMGKRMGLHTVWVGSAQRLEGVDYALESVHNMRDALPQLWKAAGVEIPDVLCADKAAIETDVRA